MKFNHKQYSDEIEETTNAIDLKTVMGTNRTGVAAKRDHLVLIKSAWAESLTYFAIVQTMVIFLGLMDDVINNINTGLRSLGSMMGIYDIYQFPVGVASFLAISFIIFLVCFGMVAYRYFGLPRRSQEIGAKMNSALFLLWRQNTELLERVKKLEDKK